MSADHSGARPGRASARGGRGCRPAVGRRQGLRQRTEAGRGDVLSGCSERQKVRAIVMLLEARKEDACENSISVKKILFGRLYP